MIRKKPVPAVNAGTVRKFVGGLKWSAQRGGWTPLCFDDRGDCGWTEEAGAPL